MTIDAADWTTFTDPRAGGLISRTGTGDRTAFGRLYDLTALEMFVTIRYRLPDRDTALAATELAFLEIWRRSPSFVDAAGSAGAWLSDIATGQSRSVS